LVTRALRDVESDPVWRRSVQQRLDVGEATLEDILTNLKKPGLDIRDDLPPPLFRRVRLLYFYFFHLMYY
jgi:transcriptional accessory protein Tex/SPT6